MSILQTFKFDNDIYIRTIIDNNKIPLFVGRDVALALGYTNPTSAITHHCKNKITIQTFIQQALNSGMTGIQLNDIATFHPRTILIYENDFYSLIFGGRSKIATEFQKWALDKLLPSIH